MNLTISPGGLRGSVVIPPSKSHTVRALVIAALADGVSRITAPLDSADTRSCISVLRELGIQIDEIRGPDGDLAELSVSGCAGRLTKPEGELDCGNSGTTFYVMLSVAALADFPVRLTGDAQLQQRSAGPLLAALQELGVTVERHGNGDCAPVTVTGPLRGGLATAICPTSQFLTSLLLATPLAPVDSELSVPLLNEKPYVEMTMGWLDSQGIGYERIDWSAFSVRGRQHYRAFEARVPGDFSAATFFLAAAAITGSTLDLTGLDINDSQGDREVVSILEKLGCTVTPGEGSIRISGPADGALNGGTLDLNSMPDSLPALAVVGTACREPLRLTNVPQAREKETDRIAVMAGELTALGARVEELPDGLVIHPSGLTGGRVSSHGDHRVAMALAVAALRAAGDVTITDAGVAGITYPGFFTTLAACGAGVVQE
jgi:3-phosphoshikimate 1-carboxyvinyltransferase